MESLMFLNLDLNNMFFTLNQFTKVEPFPYGDSNKHKQQMEKSKKGTYKTRYKTNIIRANLNNNNNTKHEMEEDDDFLQHNKNYTKSTSRISLPHFWFSHV
ncbi:U-box domain-containing protein [Trifolium repens]|nr:U-box domain-containing protein [Trifolium repens]